MHKISVLAGEFQRVSGIWPLVAQPNMSLSFKKFNSVYMNTHLQKRYIIYGANRLYIGIYVYIKNMPEIAIDFKKKAMKGKGKRKEGNVIKIKFKT